MKLRIYSGLRGCSYIQDKFTFKDNFFRLGAHVDYFDANTKKVLKILILCTVLLVQNLFTISMEPQNLGPLEMTF